MSGALPRLLILGYIVTMTCWNRYWPIQAQQPCTDFTDYWIHDESIIECLTTFYFMRSIVKRFNTKFQMIFNFLSNPLPWLLNVKIHGIFKDNFKTYHNHYALTTINLYLTKTQCDFILFFTTSVGLNTFLSVHCITDIHIS